MGSPGGNGLEYVMPRSMLPILLAISLLFVGFSVAQRYEFRDVVQQVTIKPDGTVEVHDTRTLWTDGSFGEAFLCIELTPDQRITVLPQAGALSPGPRAVAFAQPCAGGTGTEVVVRNEGRVSERRVRFSYLLEGSVDAYADVVQWFWNILETDHPPIVGYELVLETPGAAVSPYGVYVHITGASPSGEPSITQSADGSTLRVTMRRVPDGGGLEIRYLMEPALFGVSGTGEMLQRLLHDASGPPSGATRKP